MHIQKEEEETPWCLRIENGGIPISVSSLKVLFCDGEGGMGVRDHSTKREGERNECHIHVFLQRIRGKRERLEYLLHSVVKKRKEGTAPAQCFYRKLRKSKTRKMKRGRSLSDGTGGGGEERGVASLHRRRGKDSVSVLRYYLTWYREKKRWG